MMSDSDSVTLHPWEKISELVGPEPNNCLTMRVRLQDGTLYFDVSDNSGRPHPRVADTIGYIRHLCHIAANGDAPKLPDLEFVFQTDDNPADVESISWESDRDWSTITLVPDIYYYLAQGYSDFCPEVVPWASREDRLIWRGSTTGILGLSQDNLPTLLRYRLCSIAVQTGYMDCGFTNVVQAISAHEHDAVSQILNERGFMAEFIPTHEMQNSRYVIDIDGNANSWNLVQRLRLGSCMFRVRSRWEQWIEDRLIPWKHYVPVNADLSDLVEKFDWCRAHPEQSETIASAGRDFALSLDFNDELGNAARAIFSARH